MINLTSTTSFRLGLYIQKNIAQREKKEKKARDRKIKNKKSKQIEMVISLL